MGKICISSFLSITLLLLMLSTLQSSLCGNVTFLCTKEERDGLIKFKQSLLFDNSTDPFLHATFFRSWTGHNCCKWKGITCNGVNSHVVKLAIPPIVESQPFYTEWEAFYTYGFPTSLFKLRYLNHLDLSGVRIMNNTIPESIIEMHLLKYLNISILPYPHNICVVHHLGNLTNLEVLDMRRCYGCALMDVEWISNLQSIKHLELVGVDLAETRGLMKSLNTLPLLSFLTLSGCGLKQLFHLYAYSNFNSTSFLPKLQYLDISGNFIEGPIPIAFQNMTLLKVLDLSSNSFNGMVPRWFGKFTDLTRLSLSENDFQGFEGPISIEYENMTSLKVLDLSDNYFHGNVPRWFGKFTDSLNVLDLSYNFFHGMVPSWFGKFADLTHLSLRGNDFQGIEGGIFSLLRNLSNLKTLDLSWNQPQRDHMFLNDGESPLNECNLEVLDLSLNNLTGPIPVTLGSLSNLSTLDLSYNKFGGSIPDSLGKLSVLRELDLSNNILSGIIPESLGNLSALEDLVLSNNALNGISNILGRLSNLVRLDFSNNNLEGILSEIHFQNLSNLRFLDLGNNHLTLKIDHQWVPPFQLMYIRLSSCNIGTAGFPQWIQTQKEISKLVLSNAHISGTIPNWLGYINDLDLSHNQLSGLMPRFSSNLISLDLSNNSIWGPLHEDIGNTSPFLELLHLSGNHVNGTIPSSLCNITYLMELDLGRNKLSGSIPDCWTSPRLSLINFSYNNLSGVLPSSIGFSSDLASLHLNDNDLHGEIPRSLANCPNLAILDLGGNNFSGSIPPWIGLQLQQIQILRLRKNNFNGTIPPQVCSVLMLQVLDLAANNLQGTIPRCFGSIRGMKIRPSSPDAAPAPYHHYSPPIDPSFWYKEHVVEVVKGMDIEYTTNLRYVIDLDLSNNDLVGSIPEELTLLSGLLGLNLSYNRFLGNIPEKIGNMKSLESLDLSNNLISGKIPESITTLSFLSHLNLSNNNLSGKIPMGNQLQTISDPSVYVGNLLLCGDPLPNHCLTTRIERTPTVDGDRRNDVSENLLFWMVVMLGYATGFWGVIGVLLFKKSWRMRYFKFVDGAKDKVYAVVAVKVLQLNRKLGKRT